MLPLLTPQATLDAFALPPAPILTGERLRAVKELEASILRFGLLCPIVAAKDARGRLRVIDGRRRLLVIKRLAFEGRLPRSLSKIPYILSDAPDAPNPLSLLSNIEQYEQVSDLHARGLAASTIAAVLYAPEATVRDLLSVAKLSPRLRNAFFGAHIDLAQARAFATLPNPDSQDALLQALGPFVGAPEILAAIAEGQTVVELGSEEDTLILPSRARVAA